MGYNQKVKVAMNQEQFSASDMEKGRLLFAGECEFKIGAVDYDQIPESKFPEVAFCGLSNVGKSSLINSLTGRKTLARISNTPGRTKQLNFFLLKETLMLVDLPGYGYAKASKREIASWNKLITDYLKGRENLKRVCLLIDSRRGLKESDRDVMRLLDDCAVTYQIILTKTDKSKKNDVEKIISAIKAVSVNHTALHPEVISTSSVKKDGIDDLKAQLATFI